MAKKDKYTAKQVINALREANGLQSKAAEILGCTRNTVGNYIKRYPTIQDAYETSRDDNLDIAEHELFKRIRAGSDTAIIFYLKTVGKNRGYVERRENININIDVELLQRFVTVAETNGLDPTRLLEDAIDIIQNPDDS